MSFRQFLNKRIVRQNYLELEHYESTVSGCTLEAETNNPNREAID